MIVLAGCDPSGTAERLQIERICETFRDAAGQVSELGASHEEFRDQMLPRVDDANVTGAPWDDAVSDVVRAARGGAGELERAVRRLDGLCRDEGL